MLFSVVTAFGLAASVLAEQLPLMGSLDVEEEFQVYKSQKSNTHSIRVKSQNTSLCDTPVKQYTGWLDNGNKHLFFWYFEQQGAESAFETPKNDLPLMLWLTGGPGGSSMLGMLQELGPCLINDYGNGTVYNPYGWNKDTALIFVDQPVGVGFSYYDGEDSDGYPDNSYTGAEDMQFFLQMFAHEVFPVHANAPLVLTGESYGGHYVPTLGAEIVRKNLLYPSQPQVNLKSIAVGNPWVSQLDTNFGHWETLCTTHPGVDEPVFNETRCDIMAANLPRCSEVVETCYSSKDPAICHAATQVCHEGVTGFYNNEADKGAGSRNRYDITKPCESGVFCYDASSNIQQYLNLNSSRLAMSIPSLIKNYTISSSEVFARFRTTSDYETSTLPSFQYLLNNEIDVMIWSGNLDLSCNTAGSKRWTAALPWKGQALYAATELTPWISEIDGKKVVAGKAKEVSVKVGEGSTKKTKLALVTIDGAGHMVPQDQPEVALDYISRWLKGESFV